MTRSTKVFLVLALLILVAGALLIGLSRLGGDFIQLPSRAVLLYSWADRHTHQEAGQRAGVHQRDDGRTEHGDQA